MRHSKESLGRVSFVKNRQFHAYFGLFRAFPPPKKAVFTLLFHTTPTSNAAFSGSTMHRFVYNHRIYIRFGRPKISFFPYSARAFPCGIPTQKGPVLLQDQSKILDKTRCRFAVIGRCSGFRLWPRSSAHGCPPHRRCRPDRSR